MIYADFQMKYTRIRLLFIPVRETSQRFAQEATTHINQIHHSDCWPTARIILAPQVKIDTSYNQFISYQTEN